MKKVIKLTITVILLIFNKEILSQTWIRTYGKPNVPEQGMSIISSYDHGFILASEVNYNSIWIIKSDINGNIIWEKLIMTPNYTLFFYSMDLTFDGGVIITGGTNEFDPEYDPFIIKLDACGTKDWCKVLNIPYQNYGCRIKQAQNGNFILYTRYASYNYHVENNQLYEINPFGDIVFVKQILPGYGNYPFDKDATIEDICLTKDNGVLLTGWCYFNDTSNSWSTLQHLLVKTDSLGNEQWVLPHQLDTINHMGEALSCFEYLDSFYNAGYSYDPNGTGIRPYLGKYSIAGVQEAVSFIHPDTTSSEIIGIKSDNNSNLILSARDALSLDNPCYTAIYKTDTLGTLIKYVKVLEGSTINESICRTFDDKYYLSGYAPYNYSNILQTNAFVIKVNSNLEYDSLYASDLIYDSLCNSPLIISDTIICNCELFVGLQDTLSFPNRNNIKLIISPNPAKEEFSISFIPEIRKSGILQVFNLYGKKMTELIVQPYQQDVYKVNSSSWPAGLYLIRFQSENRLIVNKLVKSD